MNFDKYEKHSLEYLSFYKVFLIIVMVVRSALTLFGLYVILLKERTSADNAFVDVVTSGYPSPYCSLGSYNRQ
jgi:hypothetical protein